MAAPTFVAAYPAASWGNVTTPKTVSATTAVGDVLAILSAIEDDTALNLPTGGTGTYANQENLGTASNTRVRVDTVSAGVTAQTYTLSQTSGGSRWWGFAALRFSGSTGIGAAESANGSGGPTLNITTTAANSALVVITGDWNATDGTTRTWRTVNSITPSAGNGFEINYFRNNATYATYCAYYPDAGAAGVKTVGLSGPVGQQFTIAAVEILGTASGGSTSDPPPRRHLLPALLDM